MLFYIFIENVLILASEPIRPGSYSSALQAPSAQRPFSLSRQSGSGKGGGKGTMRTISGARRATTNEARPYLNPGNMDVD